MSKHKQFLYVAVIEEQERGAIHFHVAVHGRQSYHRCGQSGQMLSDEMRVANPCPTLTFAIRRNLALVRMVYTNLQPTLPNTALRKCLAEL